MIYTEDAINEMNGHPVGELFTKAEIAKNIGSTVENIHYVMWQCSKKGYLTVIEINRTTFLYSRNCHIECISKRKKNIREPIAMFSKKTDPYYRFCFPSSPRDI